MRAWSTILAGALLTLLTACGTALPRYVPGPIESYSGQTSRDGLVLAAKAVVAKDELVKHFGFDLLAYDVLPVLILAKNQAARDSFLLESDAYTLSAGSGLASHDQLPSPGARLWAGGGGLIGGTMMAEAMNARASVSIVTMRTYTVSPGRNVSGFVFFSMPPADKRQNLSLRVRALELASGRVINVDVHVGTIKR